MEESRLDNELKRIRTKFSYLWHAYSFRVGFITRDYGMYYRGFIIGLENNVFKLAFSKETNSSIEPIAGYLGKMGVSFKLDHVDYSLQDGWYPLTGLIYWLSNEKFTYQKDTERDLENLSQYLENYIVEVQELFQNPTEIDNKLKYYRNLYKDNQITVDRIRKKRARLHALGQNSSLEAALKNLRGGSQ